MPDNNFRFAFDFFFTDLPNHIEFLKWSRRLRKDDDILLVAALEAMYMYYTVEETAESAANEVQPRFWERDYDAVRDSIDPRAAGGSGEEEGAAGGSAPLQRGQSMGMINTPPASLDASAGPSPPVPKLCRPMLDAKHPYNLIEVYANLKKLDNREFNAIEAAYLDGGWKEFKSWRSFFPRKLSTWSESKILIWKAFLSVISQFAFTVILFFWHFANRISILDRENNAFEMVVAVAVISTLVFYNIATKQWRDAVDFNSIDGSEYWTTLDPSVFAYWLGKVLLLSNFCSNALLGPPLVLFNIYFVMTSQNPTEAILNAVALAFVLEIDDLLAPSWDEDRIEDAEANLFHDFISSPFPGDNDQFQSMRFTRTPSGPIPYQDGDKLYIKVPKKLSLGATEFYITVLRSSSPYEGPSTPTRTYQTISYKVSGNSDYIGVFHGRVRDFYCLANFDDFEMVSKSMTHRESRRNVRAQSNSASSQA